VTAASKLQPVLDEQQRRSADKRPPEVTEKIDTFKAALASAGIADRALGIGDTAPDFALPDALGREIRLGDLLGRGPVVLAFYRGGW
jgi:AhpC/TSA family